MQLLSIVIPVFNKSELTERCFASLLKHSRFPHQITVIDNNSTDNTPAILETWADRFRPAGWKYEVITNPRNVGFGTAMNQGAKNSNGKYLGLLNNDIWLLPDWDKNLIDIMERNADLDLIFPYINETHPFDEQRILHEGQRFQSKNRNRMRQTFSGVLMFYRKSSFDKLGGFDEQYFVCYEDTDLKVRMERARMKYRMVGACYIWHHAMATRSGKNMPSNYELESKAKFISKWGFDHSVLERTQKAKWLRRWRRLKDRFGYL